MLNIIEERRMSERREDTRWPPDDQQFSQCPKYLRHDLTEDQVVDLLKRGIQMYKDDQNMQIGRLTKKGFFYIVGACVIAGYSWFVAHGFISIESK